MAKVNITDFILSLGFDGKDVNKGIAGVEKRLRKLEKIHVGSLNKALRIEKKILDIQRAQVKERIKLNRNPPKIPTIPKNVKDVIQKVSLKLQAPVKQINEISKQVRDTGRKVDVDVQLKLKATRAQLNSIKKQIKQSGGLGLNMNLGKNTSTNGGVSLGDLNRLVLQAKIKYEKDFEEKQKVLEKRQRLISEKVNKNLSNFSKSLSDSTVGLSSFLKNVILASSALMLLNHATQGATQAAKTQIDYEAATASLEGMGGTLERAGQINNAESWTKAQTDFVDRLSKKFATGLTDTMTTYRALVGANITELQKGTTTATDIQDIMQAVSASVTASKVKKDDVERIFYGLTQMVSKGKVQSEELIKQMSQYDPRIKTAMAEAVVSYFKEQGMALPDIPTDVGILQKLMDEGKVTTEVLPKFAEVLYTRSMDEMGGDVDKFLLSTVAGTLRKLGALNDEFWKKVYTEDAFKGFRSLNIAIIELMKNTDWFSDRLGAVLGNIGYAVEGIVRGSILPLFKQWQDKWEALIKDPKKVEEGTKKLADAVVNVFVILKAFWDGMKEAFNAVRKTLSWLLSVIESAMPMLSKLGGLLGFDIGQKSTAEVLANILGILAAMKMMSKLPIIGSLLGVGTKAVTTGAGALAGTLVKGTAKRAALGVGASAVAATGGGAIMSAVTAALPLALPILITALVSSLALYFTNDSFKEMIDAKLGAVWQFFKDYLIPDDIATSIESSVKRFREQFKGWFDSVSSYLEKEFGIGGKNALVNNLNKPSAGAELSYKAQSQKFEEERKTERYRKEQDARMRMYGGNNSNNNVQKVEVELKSDMLEAKVNEVVQNHENQQNNYTQN